MEFELRYYIDHHESKLTCFKLGRSLYCCESMLSHESPFHLQTSCILGINVASLVLLLYQEFWSIVLVRQASVPHQSIIWITSGHQTMVRIFAHSLAPGFSVAVCWYGPAGISIVYKWSGASGFPELSESSDSFCTNLLLLRRHWADLQKSSCGKATRCFPHYHWSV